MNSSELEPVLDFLIAAEKLKDTLRTAHTSSGKQESAAEHTWRLCLMVLLFERELEGVDMLHLLKLCIVHDLGEAIFGDIPAVDRVGSAHKSDGEQKAMKTLSEMLPETKAGEVMALWEEYDAGLTPEAILAKGFDKLETILQHSQGSNPSDFDYAFNLDYGKERTDKHPLLAKIRTILDQRTRDRMSD